jgi:rSAM/selenodomain-associated transferase 2
VSGWSDAPPISIVLPALDELGTIERTLVRLREPEVREVIVVDGGSRDGTADAARRLADHVLESPRGRGPQMNRGAREASGDVLFFLHADTLVPPGFAAAIVAALATPGVVAGRFDVELDRPGWVYRLIGGAINVRSRLSRLSTGDHGLFVRRETFFALGGFPEVPLFEDLALSISLKRQGGIACLRERVRTSARRWERHGPARTVLLMWTLRSLYALGVPAERLAHLYSHVR